MRTIDLFSGCGGMSLGFQNAGFDIIAAFDNWQPAVEVYQANFSHKIHPFDLANIDDFSIFQQYEPELIIGGPPCQDFSSAGKRQEQARADLTLQFAKIISELQPKMFVMENVERIETSATLQKTKTLLRNVGYGLNTIILNASLCGVPQLRKRFFLIGVLTEKENILLSYLQEKIAQKPLSVFDYLGDSLNTEHYYRHPRSYARRGIFSVYEPSPTIRGVNRPIPPNYQFHEGDTCKDLQKIRPLTFQERSLIQTFPEDFIWAVKRKSDVEQMIGNAVPVKLAEFVANAIQAYLKQTPIEKEIQLIDTQLSLFA